MKITATQTNYAVTDEKSFNKFYDRYHRFVQKVAHEITGCDSMAKDVKQQVFLNFWEKRDKIDPLKDVLSYVFICTRNSAISYLNIRKRQLLIGSKYYLEPGATYTEPMYEIETRQIYQRMKAIAVKKLPLQCRIVYLMVFEEDRFVVDIAKEMRVTKSTVKNQKINARKKLIKFIGQHAAFAS
jgi:RNA polymerase sigma-70 factor (ECF subfamily)